MIREKPRVNRRRVFAEEENRKRAVERLLTITNLLDPDEELAAPARVGGQIIVPIVPRRISEMRYKDVVKSLSEEWLRDGAVNN